MFDEIMKAVNKKKPGEEEESTMTKIGGLISGTPEAGADSKTPVNNGPDNFMTRLGAGMTGGPMPAKAQPLPSAGITDEQRLKMNEYLMDKRKKQELFSRMA